jgi:spoIIIJ-associated protein
MNQNDVASRVEESRTLLLELLRHMDFDVQVDARPHGDTGAYLTIRASEVAALIGREGQVLEALQYVMNRIVRRRISAEWFCIVDAAGYREQRQLVMAREARDIAERVRSTGRPFTFPPLSPMDRRAVHRALANDPDLETVSLEPAVDGFKRVVIRRRQAPPAASAAPSPTTPPSSEPPFAGT